MFTFSFSKKASPPRHPCRLVAGVPEVPPARIPQPWELPGPSRDLPRFPEVPPAGVPQPSGPSRGLRCI